MNDDFARFGFAQALAAERLAAAERQRQLQRAHLHDKAWSRLRRAVALALREGLDRGEVAHEVSSALQDRFKN
jgi:hypothetical protein